MENILGHRSQQFFPLINLFFELQPMWVISTFDKKPFRWKPVLLNGLEFRTSCITLWIDHNEIKYSRKTLVTRYSTKGTTHKWCYQFVMTIWPLLFPISSLFKILWWSKTKPETFSICLKKNFVKPHKISTQSDNG